MDRSLYDDDILIWSEQQSSALRDLARRNDLPNELDLEHVAEEIEDVGRSELNAVHGLAQQIFVHLIKLLSEPDAPAANHWREEIVAHGGIQVRLTPSMPQRIDLEPLWRRAIKIAAAAISAQGQKPLEGLPAHCPITVNTIVAEEFDIDAALAATRAHLTNGSAPAKS